jgi:hypothetical protein
MPESEASGGSPGSAKLIRDIGRGGGRGLVGAATSEQHLMQLSGDPLLVRAFVSRQDTSEPPFATVPPISGDVTIALARRILAEGSLDHGATGSRRYARREPLVDASLAPSVFSPSRLDQDEAIDFSKEAQNEVRPWTSPMGWLAPFAAVALLAMLSGILMGGVPD